MFGQMLWNTWLVARGARSLGEAVMLLWTFRVPWQWASAGAVGKMFFKM